MASRLVRAASCTVAVLPVSRSCVFFVRFCFELAFGVNMKVVDNWVNFPQTLIWLENDFLHFELGWKHFKWVLEKL